MCGCAAWRRPPYVEKVPRDVTTILSSSRLQGLTEGPFFFFYNTSERPQVPFAPAVWEPLASTLVSFLAKVESGAFSSTVEVLVFKPALTFAVKDLSQHVDLNI